MQNIQDAPPELRIDADVAIITLRRPSQHNRIAPEDCKVVGDHLQQIRQSGSVRALVVTGTGSKTFSSGYTLGAIQTSLDDAFEEMLDCLEYFPLPTICAMNGSVYGGATDLALCCDFRIGVQGSRMFMPAARIGLHYYPGGLRRYVTVLGLPAAKKLFLTAQTIYDEEMLRIGFLHELVPVGQLQSSVNQYLEGLRACEPGVIASMKRDLAALAEGAANQQAMRNNYLESLRSEALMQRLAAISRS